MLYRWLLPMGPLALAAAMLPAAAQTPAPGAPASAPLASKLGPRLQTPAELRDSASPPGDLRPDERVTPQIVIPWRKAESSTKARRTAPRRGTAAASSGAIDDSAARCEAQSSELAREKCRASLVKKAPPAPKPR